MRQRRQDGICSREQRRILGGHLGGSLGRLSRDDVRRDGAEDVVAVAHCVPPQASWPEDAAAELVRVARASKLPHIR